MRFLDSGNREQWRIESAYFSAMQGSATQARLQKGRLAKTQDETII